MRPVGIALAGIMLAGCTASAAPTSGAKDAALLTDAAYGAKLTVPFTATQPWTLGYSYDCTNFGAAGTFIVTVEQESVEQESVPVGVPVREVGPKGQDETSFDGAGTYRLLVSSPCSWAVDVEQ